MPAQQAITLLANFALVSCKNVPLFVLNQVYIEDGTFTTPNYDLIAEEFKTLENKLNNEENSILEEIVKLKYQLPIFFVLLAVLCVLLLVYCRTNDNDNSTQLESKDDIFTISCDNQGFQASKEKINTEGSSDYEDIQQEESNTAISIEETTTADSRQQYREKMQPVLDSTQYQEESQLRISYSTYV